MKLLRITALVAAISSLGTVAHAGEWEPCGTQPSLPTTYLNARLSNVSYGGDPGINTGIWQFKWKWVPDPLNPTETSPAVLVNRTFTYNSANLSAVTVGGAGTFASVDLWSTVQTNATPGVDVDSNGVFEAASAANGNTQTTPITGDTILQSCRINASSSNITSNISQGLSSEYGSSGGTSYISRDAFTVTTLAINIDPA